jgi:uncharacterized membrane protein
MTRLKDAKLLGVIGSILLIIPFWITNYWIYIIGLILVLVALKFISDEIRKPFIFKKALRGVIMGLIGLVLVRLSFFPVIVDNTGGTSTFNIFVFFFFIALIATGAVMLILGMWSFKRSLDKLGEAFKISYFKMAGLFYFIGAILAITIFSLMASILFFIVGGIFLIVSFFSLPEQFQQIPTIPPQPI